MSEFGCASTAGSGTKRSLDCLYTDCHLRPTSGNWFTANLAETLDLEPAHEADFSYPASRRFFSWGYRNGKSGFGRRLRGQTNRRKRKCQISFAHLILERCSWLRFNRILLFIGKKQVSFFCRSASGLPEIELKLTRDFLSTEASAREF